MGAGVSVDARQSRRIYARLPISLVIDTPSGAVTHPAATVDLSDRGLRVSTSAALASEQIVGVILTKCPERCRVAWAGPQGSSRAGQAGLEFLDPLPE
jgi:hypothetical protein